MLIIIPIIVSILAIIYLLSPIDALPEIALGPLGLCDDFVAILIAVAVWLIYFALPLLKILFYLILGLVILVGMVYLVKVLYEKAYGKKKMKLKIRK